MVLLLLQRAVFRCLAFSISPARSLDVLVASLKVSLKTLSRQRKELHF